MAVFRLIRWPNLLVVALAQWLAGRQVLAISLEGAGFSPALTTLELWLLIMATVCITAAGYAINDLYDRPIDRINRPDKVIVGRLLSVGTARWVVAATGLSGFLFSLGLALVKGELEWLWLYPLLGILLAIYPLHLKTRPFAGNIFIAISCAGTVGLVWLAERGGWHQLPVANRLATALTLSLFMWYAFLATWIREIAKDLQDMEGDYHQHRRTLPLTYGIGKSKGIIYLLSALLAMGIIGGGIGKQGTSPLLLATVALLLVWILYMSWLLLRAQSSEHYRMISRHWKFFLLGGLWWLYWF
ncbi:MAG: geranylgeranylglycerol-phosphate geranylgeranyltransferase [Saprospiraceae bacterium]